MVRNAALLSLPAEIADKRFSHLKRKLRPGKPSVLCRCDTNEFRLDQDPLWERIISPIGAQYASGDGDGQAKAYSGRHCATYFAPTDLR
jgi:hypothetical protein